MIERVKKILKDLGTEAWLLISAENKDPYFKKIINPNTTITSVALITQTSTDVFVHSLDADNLDKDKYSVHVYNSQNPLSEILKTIITEKDIKIFSLNYSTLNDVNVDSLGHGFFVYFTDLISSFIPVATFISAEPIIYALYDVKTEEELHKMSISAKRANEILNATFKKIRPGMTELEVVELTHKETENKPDYFETEGVVLEEFSWEEESCPIVLTGESFLKGGHAMSSNRKIEKGNTVYFDFGVKLTFKDGSSWSSDIQRTGYVLIDNEKEAPVEIQNRFNIIRDSISLGINQIRPMMKGYEVDEIVRNYVKEKAQVDYDHATGHAIGEFAHNPGTVLSSAQKGLADMSIFENGVYTIEPRIPVVNGVSVEEMVVVRNNGESYCLCDRQMELIYI